MADLREEVALAGNPTNLWTERRVPGMLLGKLGRADALGAALWRLKYRGEASMAHRALVLMAARMRSDRKWQHAVSGRAPNRQGRGASQDAGLPADLIHKLAYRVLMEWVNDNCTTCHGRKYVHKYRMPEQLCPTCNGTGRMPTQHATRARDLGVTRKQYDQRWHAVVEALLKQLTQIDDEVRITLKSHVQATTLAPNVDRKAA